MIKNRPLMDSQGAQVLDRVGGANALGDVLRRLRARHGLTQEAMARHIGMNPNVYGYLERGLSPRPGMLTFARLARGTSVTISLFVRSYLGTERVEIPAVSKTVLPVPPIVTGSERPDLMGACIATIRERAGLSQARLAKAIGMQRTQVGSVESGARLNVAITTIARLVRGIAPDADLAVVVGLLAQVFADEIEREAFDQQIETFLGLTQLSEGAS